MSELYFMMTITSREMLPKFLAAYDKNNLPIGFVSLGYGTAKDDILDMLGLVRYSGYAGTGPVGESSWDDSGYRRRMGRSKMVFAKKDVH